MDHEIQHIFSIFLIHIAPQDSNTQRVVNPKCWDGPDHALLRGIGVCNIAI